MTIREEIDWMLDRINDEKALRTVLNLVNRIYIKLDETEEHIQS